MLEPQLNAGYYKTDLANLSITDGLRAKILCDVTPAKLLATYPYAPAGEVALPDDEGAANPIRQRLLTAGSLIVDGWFSNNQAIAQDILIWFCKEATLNTSFGALAITGQNTLTRTIAGNLAEGYKVSDQIVLQGSTAGTNDGLVGTPAILTAVSDTVLACNGIPFTNEAVFPAATGKIYRVSQKYRISLPANAGITVAGGKVTLFMGNGNDASTLVTSIPMDPQEVIMISAGVAVGALPGLVTALVKRALY